jgi:FMN phosphatase YigB (HAD superfamily)
MWKLEHPPYKLSLPLWTRVIFVDWFGVLTTDLFWQSILGNNRHPYYRVVAQASEELFRHDKERVRAWMTGTLSTSEVIDNLNVQFDRRSKEDFLLRRLLDDCRNVTYRTEFLQSLRHTAPDCHLVLATDNMDCLVNQFEAISSLASTLDDILASSRLGVLKVDSVRDFFSPWLLDHGLQFKEALLIDDNARTCEEFRLCGGSAVFHRSVEQTVADVKAWTSTHRKYQISEA